MGADLTMVKVLAAAYNAEKTEDRQAPTIYVSASPPLGGSNGPRGWGGLGIAAAVERKRKREEKEDEEEPEGPKRARVRGDQDLPGLAAWKAILAAAAKQRRVPVRFLGFERPVDLTWEQFEAAGGLEMEVGGDAEVVGV